MLKPAGLLPLLFWFALGGGKMQKGRSMVSLRLKEMRQREGMTQASLATVVGVDTSTSARLEREGHRTLVNFDLVYKIRMALNCSGYYLTGVHDNPRQPRVLSNEHEEIFQLYDSLDANGRDGLRMALRPQMRLMLALRGGG